MSDLTLCVHWTGGPTVTHQAEPLRVFRIHWAWRTGLIVYWATTYWKGANARAALDDFIRRNPRAITAHVHSDHDEVAL